MILLRSISKEHRCVKLKKKKDKVWKGQKIGREKENKRFWKVKIVRWKENNEKVQKKIIVIVQL